MSVTRRTEVLRDHTRWPDTAQKADGGDPGQYSSGDHTQPVLMSWGKKQPHLDPSKTRRTLGSSAQVQSRKAGGRQRDPIHLSWREPQPNSCRNSGRAKTHARARCAPRGSTQRTSQCPQEASVCCPHVSLQMRTDI